MKNNFTTLKTIKSSDGNTIIFRYDNIAKFFKKTYEENYASLSKEEKEESFFIDKEYGDLLIKIWKEPLNNILNLTLFIQDEERNPTEEYEYTSALPKDEYMTQEEWDLKIERLREHKEWFESQTN